MLFQPKSLRILYSKFEDDRLGISKEAQWLNKPNKCPKVSNFTIVFFGYCVTLAIKNFQTIVFNTKGTAISGG